MTRGFREPQWRRDRARPSARHVSGARITGTAALELAERQAKRALSMMCIGVGQGIAIAMERV
jgi:hypothetical protein